MDYSLKTKNNTFLKEIYNNTSNNSIWLELVDSGNFKNKKAESLNIFFDTEKKEVKLGLEISQFLYFSPVKFKEVKAYFYKKTNTFSFRFSGVIISFKLCNITTDKPGEKNADFIEIRDFLKKHYINLTILEHEDLTFGELSKILHN